MDPAYASLVSKLESQSGYKFKDIKEEAWIEYNETWDYAITSHAVIIFDKASWQLFDFPIFMLPELVEAGLSRRN